jgi:pyrimidine deaminase RibD-like protein
MRLSEHPRDRFKRELIMATRASVKVEHWKAITPETLVAPVEHIRKMFDEGVWKCSHLTEKLCFAGLHPEDNQIDLDPYKAPFSTYLEIIGPAAAEKFDRDHQAGTPPAIFHAFLQVMAAGIRSEIRRLFNELLQIAMVHSASLNEHPVEWAKVHLSILINSNKHVVKLWIKSACDKQDFSKTGKAQQETEDFIFWRYWRAPKLIYMQPSGSLPYDSSTAWNREDEAMTEKLLEGLSDQFILFLGFYLDKLAGDAHVGLAKADATVSAVRTLEKPDGKDAENPDRRFAAMAIEEALKSIPEDERPHPKVGAVVVKDGKVLSKAHRGEKEKSHAEYVALEDKLSDDLIAGSTVYTTLEPCTTRTHPKIPCAQRLIDRKVACVVIGMFDPNPAIWGKGWQLLREAGIKTKVFDNDLIQICEEMNREFIRAQKERQIPTKATSSTDNPAMIAARSLTDATWNLQKAAWSFFALHSQFGVARAARDVADEEKGILEKLDAALSVFTRDYDVPPDLSAIVQIELGNINIALVNLKSFSMTGQISRMEIAATQIQDACKRIRTAARPYAYRQSN